jgi:hypothetical protein
MRFFMPAIFISDANDTATVLADSDTFDARYAADFGLKDPKNLPIGGPRVLS